MKTLTSYFTCFATSFALFLSSCGSSQEQASSKVAEPQLQLAEEQTLRLNLFTEPPSLDPREANDSTSFHVLKMLFEGLTRIQPDGKPAPAAAERIDVSDDLKTYRFTLRDATWSNGEAVSAYDFEYAWRHVLDPNTKSPYAYQLYVIENAFAVKSGVLSPEKLGISVEDEKTLVVSLENPTPYFLELTAFGTYFPINKSVAERNPDWAKEASNDYITNGPFMLQSWKHHNELQVVKNPNYWDADSVKLEKIHMIMVSDESTELSMFENNEIHWAGRPISRLPADAIPSLREQGTLFSQEVAGIEWYKFNTGRFPFNHVKMRKAFSYAINRQALIEELMPDNHTAALRVVPQVLSTKENNGFFEDGNVARAQTLFNEALEELSISKDDLPPIVLSYNSNEAHHRLAQAIQQQWNQAFDIQVSLEVAEWKVHISKLRNHDFQIARLGWVADFRDPVNFLEVFKFKNDPDTGGNNDTQWENMDFVRLLSKSDSLPSGEERAGLLEKAEELFMSEMPVAPIYFMMDNYVKDRSLKGAFLSGLGDVDFKWAYFESQE